MKLYYQIIVIIISICLLKIEACPTRKICRKKQAQRLRSIKESDIVVEAAYVGKSGAVHR